MIDDHQYDLKKMHYKNLKEEFVVYVSRKKISNHKKFFKTIFTSTRFLQCITAVRDISFSFSNRSLCLLNMISITRIKSPTNTPPATNKNTPDQKTFLIHQLNKN